MIRRGDVLSREKVTMAPERITRRVLEPKTIECSLTDWYGYWDVSVLVDGYQYLTKVGSWKTKEKAEEQYQIYLDKLRRGEYELTLFSNGEVQISWS